MSQTFPMYWSRNDLRPQATTDLLAHDQIVAANEGWFLLI